jgi:3-oxoacyl-[acyl-carrier protein] reductase
MEDEIALVTGASRGIGQAVAQLLARRGATVIGTATTDAGAARITESFRQSGLNGYGKKLNVNDSLGVAECVKQVNADFGPPTILVNNAGITQDNLLMRMTEEEWTRVLDTDLTSTYRTCKAVMRGMLKARRGRIINISSVVGAMGNAGQANYAAAKAGLVGFSKSLARELASRGITVNVVAPGFIATDLTERMTDEQRQAMLGQIPLARLGCPEDVAEAVGYLASSAASYVTGETLHINGGLNMA